MFKIHRNNRCGLDVHKTWIYACIGITDAAGRTDYKEARFSAFSRGLRDLAGWLGQHSCVEVCMESAGKYWIPVFNILEQTCLVNLNHCGNRRGYVRVPNGKASVLLGWLLPPQRPKRWQGEIHPHFPRRLLYQAIARSGRQRRHPLQGSP